MACGRGACERCPGVNCYADVPRLAAGLKAENWRRGCPPLSYSQLFAAMRQEGGNTLENNGYIGLPRPLLIACVRARSVI